MGKSQATVIPIYQSIPTNICKTIERIINKCFVWFPLTNNILTNMQCGFRTVDQLIRLQNFIGDAFVNIEHSVSIFFCLEKADDTT